MIGDRAIRLVSVVGFACAMLGCSAGGVVGANTAFPGGVLRPDGPATHFQFDTEALMVGFPQYPSLSPNGEFIVFSWADDLWSVPSGGGHAIRLTAHAAYERRSALSPDGSLLAFESDRDGPMNLYVVPVNATPAGLVAGPLERVTTSDRPQTLAGFSADGTSLLYSASHEPTIYRAPHMHRAPIAGGPVERITNAFGTLPREAPGGNAYVFHRGYNGWERPKYRGSGSNDLFRMNADGSFTQLTSHAGNDGDGFILPDGSVVFVSSRDGNNNIFRLRADATDRGRLEANGLTQLTHFKPENGEPTIGHGVRDLNVSWSGNMAVFAVWDTMYTLDLTSENATPTPVQVIASIDANTIDTQRMDIGRQVSEAALSPDGKTMAVIARGEVFVRSTEEGRPTRRVTNTYGRERDLAWSPDGRVLYFTSDEDGQYALYTAVVNMSREDLEPKKPDAKEGDEPAKDEQPEAEPAEGADAPADDNPASDSPSTDAQPAEKPKVDHGKRWAESITFTVEKVIASDKPVRSPVPSPDGRTLLYTLGRGDLVLRDLATGSDRVLLESWNAPEVQWALDSRHIVYEVSDLYFNSDIWLLDTAAESAAPINITRHPDMDHSPRLSADGKVLTFLSDRGGENGQYDVWAVYLDSKLESMRPYELDQYFKDAAAAAKKRKPIEASATDGKAAKTPEPLTFDVDDAYLRVRRITSLPGSQRNLAMTPGGDRILFSATVDGSQSLFSVDNAGGDRKVVVSGNVSNVSLNLTGDRVVHIRSNEAAAVPIGGGRADAYAISAPVVIDVAKQQRQKFTEAARLLGEGFYHPTLKGLDWPALTEKYLSLAERTRTPAEFNRVTMLLFGELDGSHLGIGGGGGFSSPSPANGYLGVDVEPVANGYKITRLIKGMPAETRLKVGDIITAIEGESLAAPGQNRPRVDLHAALAGTSGREVLLEIEPVDANASRFVLIAPEGYGAESGARYRDEVARRAALVDQLSGGKLGYLHIRGMSEPSVREFERDLFAAAGGKEGLIIDVRDNGGGWTTDILLASLTAPRHAYTVPRGADPATVPPDAYPRDRRLIYAYQRPLAVLINQHSFSNAEIFAHAIKTAGRGRLVGVPTFGGVISTGSASLIDGTTVRMPGRGWHLPDGTDMEHNGAIPDVPVGQTPDDEAAGRDPQLEAAVKDVMSRIGKEPLWTGGK